MFHQVHTLFHRSSPTLYVRVIYQRRRQKRPNKRKHLRNKMTAPFFFSFLADRFFSMPARWNGKLEPASGQAEAIPPSATDRLFCSERAAASVCLFLSFFLSFFVLRPFFSFPYFFFAPHAFYLLLLLAAPLIVLRTQSVAVDTIRI